MTAPKTPIPLLFKYRHRADPELLRAVFQPMIDAVRFLRPVVEHYNELGIRTQSPLEKECQRAVQAYFTEHASDFHPTWPFVATRAGKEGRR